VLGQGVEAACLAMAGRHEGMGRRKDSDGGTSWFMVLPPLQRLRRDHGEVDVSTTTQVAALHWAPYAVKCSSAVWAPYEGKCVSGNLSLLDSQLQTECLLFRIHDPFHGSFDSQYADILLFDSIIVPAYALGLYNPFH